MKTSLTTLITLGLASSAFADTLTVGPAGSGADFDEIHEAIAAAAPGDTVLVLAGSYQDVTELEIDKPLSLIGAGSAVTSFAALAAAPFDQPLPLYVHGLAPGEEVRVAGIELRSFGLGFDGPTIAVVHDCAGPVTLADVVGFGSPQLQGGAGVVRVTGSAQVLLDDCRFGSAGAGGSSLDGQPALFVDASTVHVNACELTGSAGYAASTGTTVDGEAGIEATGGALVRVSRSQVLGGKGGGTILFLPSEQASDGGPALACGDATIYARGGSLTGGAGGLGEAGGAPIFGSGATAIELGAGAVVTTTPDVAIAPGADGDGQVTAPGVSGVGVYAQLAERLATLAVAPTVVAPGGEATVELGGEPGSLWLPFFSLAQGPAIAIPGVPGVVVLPLGGYASLPAVGLDGSGAASFGVLIPAEPTLAGASVVVQGLAGSPSGELSISSPSLVAITQ